MQWAYPPIDPLRTTNEADTAVVIHNATFTASANFVQNARVAIRVARLHFNTRVKMNKLVIAIAAIAVAVVVVCVVAIIIIMPTNNSVRVASPTYPLETDVIDGVELQPNDRVLVLDGDRAGIYVRHRSALKPQTAPRNGTVVTITEGTRFGNTFAVAIKNTIAGLRFIPQSSTTQLSMRTRLADAQTVPPTLHHVYGLWDTAPMSSQMAANREQWRAALGPTWTFKLWNRADCERLLETPELQFMRAAWAAATPRKCQQADLARYMILYTEGGWYVDLDAVPGIAAGEPALHLPIAKSTILTETILTPADTQRVADQQPIRHGIPEAPTRVANYAMGFARKHPMMREVLQLAAKRLQTKRTTAHETKEQSDYSVIYTTGPDVMSTVFAAASGAVHLLDFEKSHELVCHGAAGGWRSGADRR
jgi:hypothetical protein